MTVQQRSASVVVLGLELYHIPRCMHLGLCESAAAARDQIELPYRSQLNDYQRAWQLIASISQRQLASFRELSAPVAVGKRVRLVDLASSLGCKVIQIIESQLWMDVRSRMRDLTWGTLWGSEVYAIVRLYGKRDS